MKKKLDREKNNYESAKNSVKALSKKQKVNLNKVNEAEQKREIVEQIYESKQQEAADTFSLVLEKHRYLTLESLSIYFEAQYNFFSNAMTILNDIKPTMNQVQQSIESVNYYFLVRKFKTLI